MTYYHLKVTNKIALNTIKHIFPVYIITKWDSR